MDQPDAAPFPPQPGSGAAPLGVPPSGTGQSRPTGQRERFQTDELAIVLSHFDIGVIDSAVDFPRGSRKAPKLLITTDQGKFLLKRRAKGKDDPFKVAFCHAIQLHLASKQFPLPHLIGTKRDNNSMLQVRGNVYELFEFIPGQGYPQTLEATFDSGRILGLYHKLLDSFTSEWEPPSGTYHMAPSVERALHLIHERALQADSQFAKVLEYLSDSYSSSSEAVEGMGIENWPRQIIHADWHPGNMLFRDNHVVAVIDYDSARMHPRIIDIANGALQFSILGGSEDSISRWPDYIDESRFKRFLRGYDEAMLLSQAEIRCVPPLMIEALIAEAVFPIAATGVFGKMEGSAFLSMVHRKTKWIQRNADHLVEIAEG